MLYAANCNHSIRGAELLIKAGTEVNFNGDRVWTLISGSLSFDLFRTSPIEWAELLFTMPLSSIPSTEKWSHFLLPIMQTKWVSARILLKIVGWLIYSQELCFPNLSFCTFVRNISQILVQDATDDDGATPLFLAVSANNLMAVDELIRAGASLVRWNMIK